MKNFLVLAFLVMILSAGCKKEPKQCGPGFTGADCDQEITPSKIKIKTVFITKLPQLDPDGNAWDVGGKPDVYFVIRETQSGVEIYKSIVKNDVNITQTIVYDLESMGVYFTKPTSEYTLVVYDEDSVTDEAMGGISGFSPYIKGLGFPVLRKPNCPTCNTEWQLELEYLF